MGDIIHFIFNHTNLLKLLTMTYNTSLRVLRIITYYASLCKYTLFRKDENLQYISSLTQNLKLTAINT